MFSTFTVNVPQLDADIDRVKAKQQGVPLQNLFETMQIYLGSLYVNDFNRFGRTYQVIAQADAQFRDHPEDITRLKTRNAKGQMVPLGTLVKVTETHGPDRAMRYNGYPAAEINGGPAPGFSSGQAEALIAKLANDNLPKGAAFEWTELTYQRILAGNTAVYVYPLCLLLVFLVLAAQYESFRLPLAIILIMPMYLLFAIAGVCVCCSPSPVCGLKAATTTSSRKSASLCSSAWRARTRFSSSSSRSANRTKASRRSRRPSKRAVSGCGPS